MIVSPEKNLTAKEDERLAGKLAEYKASLTQEQLGKLVEDTRELKLYQDTPSTPEILAKIPLLSREDIEERRDLFLDRKEGGWNFGSPPQFLHIRNWLSEGAVSDRCCAAEGSAICGTSEVRSGKRGYGALWLFRFNQ